MDTKFSGSHCLKCFNFIFSNRTRLLSAILLISLGLSLVFKVQAEEYDNFLSKDQAFKVSAERTGPETASVHFDIAPGYMLYLEHFKFQDLTGKPINIQDIKMPPAKLKHDAMLGDFNIYTHPFSINIPISGQPSSGQLSSEQSSAAAMVQPAKTKGVQVYYQGCAESGFCYPPMAKNISFDEQGRAIITDINLVEENESASENANGIALAESQAHTSTSSNQNNTSGTDKTASGPESETNYFADLLENRALPFTLLTFLGLGIMLSFTPCVLPMVPILANILVGQSEKPLSKKRCLFLAGLYVLSVSLCYAAAGVAAGLLGGQLQVALQQPIFLIILSFLLLLFALNQFNLVHVQFPSIFGNALQQLEQKQKHGSAVGAIAMGAISALMVSPCVTPALVGALTYIGQKGNALLGGAALFALSLGMGLPLMIVASIGSHLLPKAGPWMKYIKYLTGILLFVLAGSILMRALPSNDPVACNHGPFIAVHDRHELNSLLATARSQKKPVILDVYADWCVSCKQMDKEIFENKEIQKQLSTIQLLRFDLTHQTKGSEQLQKELGIVGPPMVLFFDHEGKELKSYRLAGKSETHSFLERVNHLIKLTTAKN